MHVLETSKFSNFDPKNITNFVRFWEHYYGYETKKLNSDIEIKYVDEINLGNDLTKSNVRELLRWKDPKYLTSKILSGPNEGNSNERVERVLKQMSKLNDFRHGRLNHEDFWKVTDKIFSTGIVWKLFLFHICKPFDYPIVDQHVLRSYSCHKNCTLPENWDKYCGYREYFNKLCKSFRCGTGDNLAQLKERKRVDNALMMYGRFLKEYG